jgi:PAS domain S-box-containing protein
LIPPVAAEAFAGVIAVLPEAMLLATSAGEILAANDRAAAMLGVPAAQLRGGTLFDYVTDDRDAVATFLRMASRSKPVVPAGLTLKGGESRLACRFEGAVLVPRDGARPAVLSLRVIPKEAAVNRFVALNLRVDELSREIARRQQAELSLREQTELLRVTLSSIGDAVIATDAAGRVTFTNGVAEHLTGWTHAQASGRALEEVFRIVNEETRAPVESPVARVLRLGKVVGLANHTLLVARDGAVRPIDDSGAPIRDASGKILGVILVFRDVTERRSFERERVAADRRKDEFLAMLAHELRNPLAVFGSGVQAIRMAQRQGMKNSEEELVGLAEAMERQVAQLARLVDDLLDVARISTGKIALRKARVDLETVIRRAVEMLQPMIAARDADVVLTLAPGPLAVEADGARLAQVFGNLLANALKFSEPGARIELSSAEESGHAVVRVVDRGIGIPAEMLPSIFELFVQADTGPARERGGLGVGLTVAKIITALHGGSVEARSEGPGRGAEFRVRLPLVPQSERSERRAGALAGARQSARRRILVVDDNPDAAASLALLLRFSGHEVQVAHNGEAALRAAETALPDAVLLDVGMPGMDGYEVARSLRERPGTRGTLIIAVTGYGADADRSRGRAAGFDHHLTKPVELAAIEELFARRGAAGGERTSAHPRRHDEGE